MWKFDVKNDIGFYLGDEDRIKGGNLVYLPYTHSVFPRGNSHRILISDQQLLQWYSRRRDIRHSPLPYCVVQTAILDLLADRTTPAGDDKSAPILVTPLTDPNDNITLPQQPAVIQHLEMTTAPAPPIHTNDTRRRLATHINLPSTPPHRNATTRIKCIPHNISSSMNAATTAIHQIMSTDSPAPPLFDDNHHPPDADTLHAYAIDTLFVDPSYHTTDTEEIETKEALLAPDRDKFIAAIRLEVDSLINVTKTLIPIHRDATGNFPTNTLEKRVWKIRTTLKCKRKKRANGEPDKHKA